MEIVITSLDNKYLEILSFENWDNFNEIFKKISSIKGPLEAKIFVINDSISSHQLSILKKIFDKINNCSMRIYSNNRNTVLAGRSQKIDTNFVNEHEIKNNMFLFNSKKKEDILHEGTVRSGDRISSNGNLCIIGDVNPGAIVSAKNNIYVWGKLLGIAFAGRGGNNKSSISSLYLRPLQLRIADIIAIGPKDKPQNSYPEIAVVDNQTIIIKPYIIETRN
ncbi:septum site-determining protein MinC [Prochlorococcus marinus str. MU1402]|uniref:septum site-determining protein MinC n=1 Tax=Prochlorococcus marinus TaxID=1219 RepID=UPI001ADA3829|nr:septum site-determining protein MinC [Prochlorococcus marinus]MBO8231348.1 septum site-determining protein MinC [Prochlorococcus marinus XMU1402]MBW3056112.1 septum site-determining protein MinC [Prochlorococcus marinus str. MU1402]